MSGEAIEKFFDDRWRKSGSLAITSVSQFPLGSFSFFLLFAASSFLHHPSKNSLLLPYSSILISHSTLLDLLSFFFSESFLFVLFSMSWFWNVFFVFFWVSMCSYHRALGSCGLWVKPACLGSNLHLLLFGTEPRRSGKDRPRQKKREKRRGEKGTEGINDEKRQKMNSSFGPIWKRSEKGRWG